jgi:Bifunctional DNA primase/polymerase, N-terminal/Primase C terminal 1 (PriCT-1)/Helix-turn-helix domain
MEASSDRQAVQDRREHGKPKRPPPEGAAATYLDRRTVILLATACPKTPPLLHAALEIIAPGFPVIPLTPGRKSPPLWKGWATKATSDPNEVMKIWDKTPMANIGVVCGRGLVVIDTDGPAGDEALQDVIRAPTTTVKTPRGHHYYFLGTAPTRAGVLPKVDIRGDRGYVVGPGSRRTDGGTYGWLIPPWEQRPIALPAAVGTLLEESSTGSSLGSSARWSPGLDVISEGMRNSTLTSLAGNLRVLGLSGDEIEAALHAANTARCRPPLAHSEVSKIARSAGKWPDAPPWVADPLGFIRDPRLKPFDRLLLHVLAQHADRNGVAWPGIDRLADLTGASRPTVISAIKRLEAADRAHVTRTHQRPNRYCLRPRPRTSCSHAPSPTRPQTENSHS